MSDKIRENEISLKHPETERHEKKEFDRQRQRQINSPSVKSPNSSVSVKVPHPAHPVHPVPTKTTAVPSVPHTGGVRENSRTYPKPKSESEQRTLPIQKHRAARARRQRRIAVVIIAAAVAALFFAALLLAESFINGEDELCGSWSPDNITVYEFDGKGSGSLNLPENSYPFTYEIKDNSLKIDFESESARDITYSFTVKDGKLSLVSVEKGKEITYLLTKKNAD